MTIDSAQIKSSIILASLYSSEKTNIYENIPTRDHKENMINFLGGNITRSKNIITINPKNNLVSKNIEIKWQE